MAGGAGAGGQSAAWTALQGFGVLSAVLAIVWSQRPTRADAAVGLVLGLLVWLAYLPIAPFSSTRLPNVAGTVVAVVAMRCVARSHPDGSPGLLRRPALRSVVIGVVVGLVFGAVNLATAGAGNPWDPALRWPAFLVVLSPAILEETVARGAFLAVAVAALRGAPRTRSARLVTWLLMIVPHAIVHTVPLWQQGRFGDAVVTTVFLGVLFGLPFAILQRRRDLLSASVAHGLVDLVRFLCLGLPY